MKLDKKLNLVLTIKGDTTMHVHSTPVSLEVYESNYRLISRAAVGMYNDQLGAGACARIAMMAIKDTASDMDAERGEIKDRDGNVLQGRFAMGAEALLGEIWRLTNVVVEREGGWETLPFYTAMKNGLIEPDALREAQNAICFFTLASWFHRSDERENIYKLMTGYGAQIVSSNSTEFMRSLPTSTEAASTGETERPPLMPV